MTTDVYGDILFLINAGMDCLSCLLTAGCCGDTSGAGGWRLPACSAVSMPLRRCL